MSLRGARVTKPLDADEEARAGLLARAGQLSAGAARMLAALLRGGGWSAQQVADATGLARQDVSRAARELDAAALVTVDKVASGGRPTLRYHLARGAIATLVARRREAIREELAALAELEGEGR